MARALGFSHYTEIKKGGKRKKEKKERKNTLSWGFSSTVEGPRSDSLHHENKHDNEKNTLCQMFL